MKRAEAISDFRKRSDFEMIYNAFNRVIRILPKEITLKNDENHVINVKEELLEDQSEKDLFASIVSVESDVKSLAANGEYNKVLEILANLRTAIDKFFDEVMVMSDVPELRKNRLALLQRLASMFYLVADFSKIVE